MGMRRRGLGQAVMFAAAASVLPAAHAVSAATPGVVVSCDPALRTAMEAVGRLFTARIGPPVHVFCAAPALMLAQLERQVQNDVLVTEAAWMDEAARRALIGPATRVPLGANRLVLATATPMADHASIRALIADGPLAIPDRTSGTTVDSAAVLARLGFTAPLPFLTIGAIDTEDVAFLVRTGAARLGLLYRTEAQPGSGLFPAAALPDEPPIAYAAAISVLARRPHAAAFLEFLRGAEAASRLTTLGLTSPP